ncbi:MAG: response regulator [Myxococcota bacterium]
MANVLIAEDETELAETLAEVLGAAGHAVRSSASREGALRTARGFAVDLLISDWALGGSQEGALLVERLRAERPALRAIVMTGYPSARLRSWVESDDALGVLEKPFSLSEFRALVARLLGVTAPA